MLNLHWSPGKKLKFSLKNSSFRTFFSANSCNLTRFTDKDALNWHSIHARHTIFEYHFVTMHKALWEQLWSLEWSRREGKSSYCSLFSQASLNFTWDIEDGANYAITAGEKAMPVLKKETIFQLQLRHFVIRARAASWIRKNLIRIAKWCPMKEG